MKLRTAFPLAAGTIVVAAMVLGTWHNPDFWSTPVQRGDRLMAKNDYKAASETYTDPWHIAVALYRNGDLKEAAPMFARVPGAEGAFDQGNALLMHGAYEEAMASYDRALGFRPGWQDAIDNKALAEVRKQRIDDAGANRDQESAEAYDPDEVVADKKGDDKKSKPEDMSGQQMSDQELRSTWLRRVQTSPGDFLRAKFAYQAVQEDAAATEQDAGQSGGQGGAR